MQTDSVTIAPDLNISPLSNGNLLDENIQSSHICNEKLEVIRLDTYKEKYFEIKDPSITKLPDKTYMMYASIGNSYTQQWVVGRFVSDSIAGPWQEISPVKFHNLIGRELCAPAVIYEVVNGQGRWTMYIQTTCFTENGVIAQAVSQDGENFYSANNAEITKEMIHKNSLPVVGLYDAGISYITINDERYLCMLFSGYRKIGCGDIYMTCRKQNDDGRGWSSPSLLLAQEDVPFHNKPTYEHYEWGLEGGQILQITPSQYLMIGVCFMPRPAGFSGTRQRVFFALSDSINGPFKPVGTPLEPQYNPFKTGENGHPDGFIEDEILSIVYQERIGEKQPWHLRLVQYSLTPFSNYLRSISSKFFAPMNDSCRV